VRNPVERYVNQLLRRRRPAPFAPTQDDVAVLGTAIDLVAATSDAVPRPDFVESLRERLSEQERAGQDSRPARPAWRTSARRRFLAAGALTAAGVAAGAVAGGAVAEGLLAEPADNTGPTTIDPSHGRWQDVAASDDLPDGTVRPFDLGTVTGFVRRASGRLAAVSGTCTHQGCQLALDPTRDHLACPCHGATFTLSGTNLTHPRRHGGPLPALPRLAVREHEGQIQIWAPPRTTTP
jgi:cytochrome b6-f complex iron-sulfur subunit